jgi:hypothetical protein
MILWYFVALIIGLSIGYHTGYILGKRDVSVQFIAYKNKVKELAELYKIEKETNKQLKEL